MVYEWKFLPGDFENKITKEPCSLHERLEKISFEEIKDIKNRINFCLAHLKVISKYEYSQSTDYQLNFLKKINSLLESEIHERQSRMQT